MDDIQITVNKFRTEAPHAQPVVRARSTKILRLLDEARETLELFPDGEHIVRNQTRNSWINHERRCDNADLEFRYIQDPTSGISHHVFDYETSTWKTVKRPLRHDVVISRRKQEREALVDACSKIGGFFS